MDRSWKNRNFKRLQVLLKSSFSNLKFIKSFPFDFRFEEKQELKFVVHIVNKLSNDLIGEASTTIGGIVGSRVSSFTTDIVNIHDPKRKNGLICARIEELSQGIDLICDFTFSCQKLDKKDFFGSSDPIHIIF